MQMSFPSQILQIDFLFWCSQNSVPPQSCDISQHEASDGASTLQAWSKPHTHNVQRKGPCTGSSFSGACNTQSHSPVTSASMRRQTVQAHYRHGARHTRTTYNEKDLAASRAPAVFALRLGAHCAGLFLVVGPRGCLGALLRLLCLRIHQRVSHISLDRRACIKK